MPLSREPSVRLTTLTIPEEPRIKISVNPGAELLLPECVEPHPAADAGHAARNAALALSRLSATLPLGPCDGFWISLEMQETPHFSSRRVRFVSS